MNSSLSNAQEIDAADELAGFRDAFCIPTAANGEELRYLSGHSLGLMPKRARALVARELDRWETRGVDGHFDADGWFTYHERFAEPLAGLLGAEIEEVVVMNSLTTNLHLMLASFFRPDTEQNRILIEQQAFPSDRFAVQSQLAFHGLDPKTDLVELNPERPLADALDATLHSESGRVALVLLPGVQYLNGEAVDLAACTEAARRHGCRIGFDLAHAIGNVPIDLRTAEPDFAVWCSYKYLNGGPGAIGGCFVNRHWHRDRQLPRLAGWWGHVETDRFSPSSHFTPIPSAGGWQLSNPPILSMLPLEASLALFDEAGIARLRQKSVSLTGYLETLLVELCGDRLEPLTPSDPGARGAQLSLRLRRSGESVKTVVERVRDRGVIIDWREPDVLRLAPVPLYNSYVDVHAAVSALAAALAD